MPSDPCSPALVHDGQVVQGGSLCHQSIHLRHRLSVGKPWTKALDTPGPSGPSKSRWCSLCPSRNAWYLSTARFSACNKCLCKVRSAGGPKNP